VLGKGACNVYQLESLPPQFDSNNIGKLVASLKYGDQFGELALIHNAPRSATVVATEDTECWTVDARSFNKLLRFLFDSKTKDKDSPSGGGDAGQKIQEISEDDEEVGGDSPRGKMMR